MDSTGGMVLKRTAVIQTRVGSRLTSGMETWGNNLSIFLQDDANLTVITALIVMRFGMARLRRRKPSAKKAARMLLGPGDSMLVSMPINGMAERIACWQKQMNDVLTIRVLRILWKIVEFHSAIWSRNRVFFFVFLC